MLEKLKNLLNRIIAAFKALWDGRATPPPAKPLEALVEAPRPILKPSTVATPEDRGVTVGKPGNEVRLSGPTAAFLGVSDGNIPDAPTYNPQPGSQDTSQFYNTFTVTSKSHPYICVLTGGQVYTYTIPTGVDEQVTIIVHEVQGTPDSQTKQVQFFDFAGVPISGVLDYGRHGSYTFTSRGGLVLMKLVLSVTSPVGVQRR